VPGLLEALERAPADGPAARVVRDVVAHRSVADVRGGLTAWLGAEPALPARLRALRVLGRLGDGRLLPVAVNLMADVDPNVLADRRVTAQWRGALAPMLADGADRHEIVAALRELPRRLDAANAGALVASGNGQALAALLDLLRARAGHPAPWLDALAKAPPLLVARLHTAALVSSYLHDPSPKVRAAAASLVARARAVDAGWALIGALDDRDDQVAAAVHRALRALTGADEGPDSEAWRTWWDREHDWAGSADVDRRLRSEEPGEVVRALQDVVAHRFVCARKAQAVAELLQDDSPVIRRLACAALGALGRVSEAPALVSVLEEDAGVRRAAQSALEALSGEHLGADARAWRRRLHAAGLE
jgi:HEAT repeat protein